VAGLIAGLTVPRKTVFLRNLDNIPGYGSNDKLGGIIKGGGALVGEAPGTSKIKG
jgi:hypothetical protein